MQRNPDALRIIHASHVLSDGWYRLSRDCSGHHTEAGTTVPGAAQGGEPLAHLRVHSSPQRRPPVVVP